jgi:hypothetical protein
MINDHNDTWGTADLLIQEHGKDAAEFAAMRADELLQEGDLKGVVIWLGIALAVLKLMSKGAPAGNPIH